METAASIPAPFVFWKAAFLVEVLPFWATSLGQLLTGVTLAPEMSLSYHLHQQFFRAPHLLPAYPNDFAIWTDTVLGNAVVAERLANLNLLRCVDLAVVRRELSLLLAEHLRDQGDSRVVLREQRFIFCQPRLVVFPSGPVACTPAEFLTMQGADIEMSHSDRAVYLQCLRDNAPRISLQADVVIVHDPQPAYLIDYSQAEPRRIVWRCHIDLSQPHDQVWRFLQQAVRQYAMAVFHVLQCAQHLPIPQVLIAPSIDPRPTRCRTHGDSGTRACTAAVSHYPACA